MSEEEKKEYHGPRYLITYDGREQLTAQDIQRIKEQWVRSYGGKTDLMILPNNFKVSQIDTDFLSGEVRIVSEPFWFERFKDWWNDFFMWR